MQEITLSPRRSNAQTEQLTFHTTMSTQAFATKYTDNGIDVVKSKDGADYLQWTKDGVKYSGAVSHKDLSSVTKPIMSICTKPGETEAFALLHNEGEEAVAITTFGKE